MKKLIAIGLLSVGWTGAGIAQIEGSAARDTFGCMSKDLTNRLIEIAKSGDSEAFSRGFTAGVLSGQCRQLPQGARISITDTSLLSGLTAVRVRGDVASFWVPSVHVDATGRSAPKVVPPPAPLSSVERYGKGERAFEAWAREQYFAEKFRYVSDHEVWVSTTAHAPVDWHAQAASAIAEHYRLFLGVKGPVAVKLFANNEEVASVRR